MRNGNHASLLPKGEGAKWDSSAINWPIIFRTPYYNGTQQVVLLLITLDESGVLTLLENNDTLSGALN